MHKIPVIPLNTRLIVYYNISVHPKLPLDGGIYCGKAGETDKLSATGEQSVKKMS